MSPCPGRPTAAPPTLARIPDDLKALHRWVVWRYAPRPDGSTWAKPLYTPATGAAASHSDEKSWGSYAEAVAAYQHGTYEGLGFVFDGDDGYVGIDLDKAMRPDGTLKTWAFCWVKTFARVGAYIETSPSGQGVHIIVPTPAPWDDGQQPQHKKTFSERGGEEGGAAEIYNTQRYFTVTGHPVPEVATIPLDQIITATEAAAAFYEWFCGLNDQARQGKNRAPMPSSPAPTTTTPAQLVDRPRSPVMSDAEIVRHARAMRNGVGQKFACLYDAPTPEGGDDSHDDCDLIDLLAYWTQDAEQIVQIMDGSARRRPKWDEPRNNNTTTWLRNEIGPRIAKHLTSGKVYRGPQARPQTNPCVWTDEHLEAKTADELRTIVKGLNHLLANPSMDGNDKVVAANTWFATDRFPGITPPEGESFVQIRCQDMAQTCNLSPDRFGKILGHIGHKDNPARQVVRTEHTERRDGKTFTTLWCGAPEDIVPATTVMPEAAHRKKDAARKECDHCRTSGLNTSAFKTTITCLECGAILKETISGHDAARVAAEKEKLAATHAAEGFEPGLVSAPVESTITPPPPPADGHFTLFLTIGPVLREDGLRIHRDVLRNIYISWCHDAGEEKEPLDDLEGFLEDEGCMLRDDFWYGLGPVWTEPAETQSVIVESTITPPAPRQSVPDESSPLCTQVGGVLGGSVSSSTPQSVTVDSTITPPGLLQLPLVPSDGLLDQSVPVDSTVTPWPRIDHQRRYGDELLDQLGIATPGARPG